jgi:hypothetical protein
MNESDIEDNLATHPYLIDKKFLANTKYTLKRQEAQSKEARTDLVFTFEHDKEIILVELKKTILKLPDYKQILRYYQRLRAKYSYPWKINGYLIGYPNPKELDYDKRSFKWLKLLYLEKDVPTQIWVCGKCRKANSTISYECKFCYKRR